MRRFWVVLSAAVLIFGIVVGPGLWGRFHYWLYFGKGDEATKTQAISAGVQAFATVALLIITGYYAYITRQALGAAKAQAAIADKEFQASMIPRLALTVLPHLDNNKYIRWEIENNSDRDLLIQEAEIRWNYPGKEWSHRLMEYPGGVFEPGRKLNSTELSAVPIPDEHWPTDQLLTFQEVHKSLSIAVTVSDVAQILAFRFDFTPGKGQNVTVVQERS